MTRPLPIGAAELEQLAQQHGTPLYVYDAATIRARVAQLSSFDVVRYAQKANSNLAILRLVSELGCCVDAVSAGEIDRARLAFDEDQIAYTADVFTPEALEAVRNSCIGVNCGSLDMLPVLAEARSGKPPEESAPDPDPHAHVPPELKKRLPPDVLQELSLKHPTHRAERRGLERKLARRDAPYSGLWLPDVTLRVNPGFGHGHHAGVATGGEASKHGIWHEDLPRAIDLARELGLAITGLHVHVGSGSDLDNLTQAAGVLERWASALRATLRSLSAGGGLPVPYRDEDPPFDARGHFEAWDAARKRANEIAGRRLALEVEPGRFLVAESGVLLARVLGTKVNGGVPFVLVDAGFHTLVRPAMYGAYHRILPLGRARGSPRPTVVAGPLCESGDVFTRTQSGELEPRALPPLERGDLLAIADAGAYGMSMASRYNSQPLPAEVLVDAGAAKLVRRRESFFDWIDPELRPT